MRSASTQSTQPTTHRPTAKASAKADDRWTCQPCRSVYPSVSEYRHHLSNVEHRTDPKVHPYWCEICKLGFKQVNPRTDASYLQHLHSKNHQISLFKFFTEFYCLDCYASFDERRKFVCHLRSDEHAKNAIVVHSNREAQRVFSGAVAEYLQSLSTPGETASAQGLSVSALLGKQRPVQTRCGICDTLSRDVPLCEHIAMPECEHWACRLCLKGLFVRFLTVDPAALTRFMCCTCQRVLPHTFVLKVITE